MQPEITKRVSLIELFYDLVFVYMIARATNLIHHLDHGVISLGTLLIFAFVVIIFINSWMVQSVFTNRYGKSSWSDIGFAFVDMMIVLYMSNSFSSNIPATCIPSSLLLAYYLSPCSSNIYSSLPKLKINPINKLHARLPKS